jgi:hypothetical protein
MRSAVPALPRAGPACISAKTCFQPSMLFPTDASFARKSWTTFGRRLFRDLSPARHPLGVKRLLDRWLAADGITDVALFRTLRKGTRSARKAKTIERRFGLYGLGGRRSSPAHIAARRDDCAPHRRHIAENTAEFWTGGPDPGETPVRITSSNRSRSGSGNRELMRSEAIPRQ